ncbi:MAG TPA: hypothetical protein VIJ79_15570 [Acidobacteriaceae bacterium]
MGKPASKAVCAVLAVAGFAVMSAKAMAQQNSACLARMLTDPAPRPPDLEKMYGKPTDPVKPDTSKQVAEYNRRRFELIARTSVEVAVLAETLQKSLAQPQSDAVLAQEAQVAAAVEQLAGNIHMVLLPDGLASRREEGTMKAKLPEGAEDLEQMRSRADALAEVAKDLHAEVDKSGADTLSIGVLTKSAQVRDIAHDLKVRMGKH